MNGKVHTLTVITVKNLFQNQIPLERNKISGHQGNPIEYDEAAVFYPPTPSKRQSSKIASINGNDAG